MKRFTDDEIDQASRVNLIELAASYNLNVKHYSNGTYVTEEHDSLKITPSECKWNWHSQNVGGGPIQFVMHMEGIGWVDAVKSLLDKDPEEFRKIDISLVKPKEKGPFVLPEKNDTLKHVIAYLSEQRAINREVIISFIQSGQLYENDKKSCVFVGKDKNGEAKYAAIRGTNTYGTAFKGEATNSDKSVAFGIEGKDDTLYTMESPIEVMSYLSLEKLKGSDFKSHIIAAGGTATLAIDRYLEEHPDIKTLNIGSNNDEAGHRAYLKLYEKYADRYDVNRVLSVQNDFNDELRILKGKTLPYEELELANQKNPKLDKVPSYLSSLGISDNVMLKFVMNETLIQSMYGNCLFLGRDENNELKSAYAVSTNTEGVSYEGFVKGSNTSYPFELNGSVNKVSVFTNPIEMLSYLSLVEMHEKSLEVHVAVITDKEMLKAYIEKNNITKVIFCSSDHETVKDMKANCPVNFVEHKPKGNSFQSDLMKLRDVERETLISEDDHIAEDLSIG